MPSCDIDYVIRRDSTQIWNQRKMDAKAKTSIFMFTVANLSVLIIAPIVKSDVQNIGQTKCLNIIVCH